MAFLQSYIWPSSSHKTSPPSPPSNPSEPAPFPAEPIPSQSTRAGPPKNALLFLGGITFMAFSTLITRRALSRKYRTSLPPFYTASTRHNPPVDGATEALEALSVATINVVSAAMVVGGGALWYFDINTVLDMRRRIRGGLGVAGDGQSEEEAEEEMEEWLAGVLARKDEKETKRRKGDKGEDEK